MSNETNVAIKKFTDNNSNFGFVSDSVVDVCLVYSKVLRVSWMINAFTFESTQKFY